VTNVLNLTVFRLTRRKSTKTHGILKFATFVLKQHWVIVLIRHVQHHHHHLPMRSLCRFHTWNSIKFYAATVSPRLQLHHLHYGLVYNNYNGSPAMAHAVY